jgi:hypothetical protein
MFAPLVALPNWVAITWMIIWAVLGYIFAPYGMWKAQRKNRRIASPVCAEYSDLGMCPIRFGELKLTETSRRG